MLLTVSQAQCQTIILGYYKSLREHCINQIYMP